MVKLRSSRLDSGSALPFLSFTVNETTGSLPAVPFLTLAMAMTTLVIRLDSIGTTCAPTIEASKSLAPCGIWQGGDWFFFGSRALRDMAGGALIIVGLRAGRVIRAGHEVYVVVAGSAGDSRGFR